MDPARRWADIRGNIFQKSNDVMVSSLFDFGDLIDLELPFFANDRCIFFRDQTQPRHRFAGDGFDFEPDLEFAFIRPDRAHLRSGITVNHPGNIKGLPKAGKRLLRKENAPAAQPPERLNYFSEFSRPWRAKTGRDLRLVPDRCRASRPRWRRFRGCFWC